jgi:hypothetical protein
MAMQRAAQLLPQLRAAVQAGDQKAQALLTELKVGGVLSDPRRLMYYLDWPVTNG